MLVKRSERYWLSRWLRAFGWSSNLAILGHLRFLTVRVCWMIPTTRLIKQVYYTGS